MNREKNLESCLVIMTGLLVFWFVYKVPYLLMAALVIGIIGAFFDHPAGWINWLWYKIADVVGAVMSKVLLSAVFFLFLSPIALLYRFFSKDGLQLKKKGSDGSYWTERSHRYKKRDLENMW